MITEILIKMAVLFLTIFDKLLPNWSIPDEVINAFSTFGVSVLKWNGVLPIKAIIEVILMVITIYLLIAVYKALFSIISLVRGGGTM